MSFCQHSVRTPQTPWGKTDDLDSACISYDEDDGDQRSSEDEGRLFIALGRVRRDGEDACDSDPSSVGGSASPPCASAEDMDTEDSSSSSRTSSESGENCSSDPENGPSTLSKDLRLERVAMPVNVDIPLQSVDGDLERTPLSQNEHHKIITPPHVGDYIDSCRSEFWTDRIQSNLDDTPMPLPKPRKVRSYWHSHVGFLIEYQERQRQANGGSCHKPAVNADQVCDYSILQKEVRRKELHKRTQWSFFRTFKTVRPFKTEEEDLVEHVTRQE